MIDERTILALALLVGGVAEAAAPSHTRTPQPAQQIDSAPIVAQRTRKPVTGKPKQPRPPASSRLQQPTSSTAPTVDELADLYMRVGRQLTKAYKRDADSTFDLWPRYRWIRFMDAMKTPATRQATAAILQRLQADLNARTPQL